MEGVLDATLIGQTIHLLVRDRLGPEQFAAAAGLDQDSAAIRPTGATLEDVFVTPVGRAGLLLGKLIPYAAVGFVETLVVLLVMVHLFEVPIHGSLSLLLTLALLFLVCSLATTQTEALQFAFIIMLPSVLLSGFMFPRSEMPAPIYLLTFAIPVTYFIEILRGIVLRGADFVDLIPQTVGLATCCLVVLTIRVVRCRKQLA